MLYRFELFESDDLLVFPCHPEAARFAVCLRVGDFLGTWRMLPKPTLADASVVKAVEGVGGQRMCRLSGCEVEMWRQ